MTRQLHRPNRAAVIERLGRAIYGAALMAAAGGNLRQMNQGANVGMMSGLNQGGAHAMTRQQTVGSNCTASRVYRVLDGTAAVSFNMPAQQAPAAQSARNAGQIAKLIGKGPGYESYSFACTNRETLIVRCEMGNCRALK